MSLDDYHRLRQFFGLEENPGSIPNIPNLKKIGRVSLTLDALLRGLLIIGKPSMGKTRLMSAMIVEFMKGDPTLSVLILDASDKLRMDIVGYILALPKKEQEPLLKRLVIDIPFHPEYTQSTPLWHKSNAADIETQIQMVRDMFITLNPDTVKMGFAGKPFMEKGQVELYRILSSIENEFGDNWQITEAEKLMAHKTVMESAIHRIGMKVPNAKEYFDYLHKLPENEYDSRTYAYRSILGVFDSNYMKARFGHYKPTYTLKEIEEQGLCCIVSGGRTLGHELEVNYIFTQLYMAFKALINRRTADSPSNTYTMLVNEEARYIYDIPGLGKEISGLTSFYRTRKAIPVIDIQGTWQTGIKDEIDRRQLWSIGNIILFGLDSVEDAWEALRNIASYDPSMEQAGNRMVGAKPEHSQYTIGANWIQHFKRQEILMRRYLNQAQIDDYINYIPHVQNIITAEDQGKRAEVEQVTEQIFKSRAVPIRDALQGINQRYLPPIAKPTQGNRP